MFQIIVLITSLSTLSWMLKVVSHNYRSCLTLARGCSAYDNISWICCNCLLETLGRSICLLKDHHHGSGNTIRIKSVEGSHKTIWFKTLKNYYLSPSMERWHITFKAALMCHTDLSWIEVLPTVLLSLRTVQISFFFLLFYSKILY